MRRNNAGKWQATRVALILGLAASIFAGCIVVPYGGWDDEEHHHHEHRGWDRD